MNVIVFVFIRESFIIPTQPISLLPSLVNSLNQGFETWHAFCIHDNKKY